MVFLIPHTSESETSFHFFKNMPPSGESEPSSLSVVAAVRAQSSTEISYKHRAIVWKIIDGKHHHHHPLNSLLTAR